jgi:hypothetical protein
MGQKLEIEVSKVMLVRRDGPDELSLTINDPEMLARICGEKIAEEVWHGDIHLEIKISHGKGERLAKELGLTIDETVEVSRFRPKFSQ